MSKVYVFTEFGGPEAQELIDRPEPHPGAGELAVQVRAAGVNPADWKTRADRHGTDQPLPAPMGHELSGVVTAIGADVHDFTVGQEILGLAAPGHGAFAEHTIVRATDAVAKPEEISFADAATIPVAAAAAYDATHQIELEPGQKLLVIGAGGGVGLMVAQIGRVHEFTVIGIASESKRKVVESTGATFVPSGDGVADRARQAAPDGVDLILDLVGGEALREVADLVADPTRIISAADPATATELGGTGLVRTPQAMAKITGVIEYDLVDPHISALYPLERAGEAIATVEDGHATGKIVLEMLHAPAS
ncbi:NADP-dependent oxidoreductase [uncultured Cellulomonas sp.]|uniref:NADP-dependent oxidoreductase n=1 Tax=uncultured Cellulomonas sp. TaxID=189682 RepID=UPI0026178B9B|nr:NADP-dependent oxidoreductase [uncultured Cellulomonas sp.]